MKIRVGINDREAAGSNDIDLNSNDGLYEVMARGFVWNVRRSDVGDFFSNVKILGGVEGIVIRKNGAMEATFFVDSVEEAQKALSYNQRCIGTRKIYGMLQIWYLKSRRACEEKNVAN